MASPFGSIVSGGAAGGAVEGLREVLARRLREQNLLQQLMIEQERNKLEQQRINQVGELGRGRLATEAEHYKLLREAQGKADERAARDDLRMSAVLRQPGSNVTPEEFQQETTVGKLPTALYRPQEGPTRPGEALPYTWAGTGAQTNQEESLRLRQLMAENNLTHQQALLELQRERLRDAQERAAEKADTVVLTAQGKNAMSALKQTQLLATRSQKMLEEAFPGIMKGQHPELNTPLNRLSAQAQRVLYSAGFAGARERLIQTVELLKAAGVAPYLHGTRNQKIWEQIQAHMGDPRQTPAMLYNQMKGLLELVPIMESGIIESARPLKWSDLPSKSSETAPEATAAPGPAPAPARRVRLDANGNVIK